MNAVHKLFFKCPANVKNEWDMNTPAQTIHMYIEKYFQSQRYSCNWNILELKQIHSQFTNEISDYVVLFYPEVCILRNQWAVRQHYFRLPWSCSDTIYKARQTNSATKRNTEHQLHYNGVIRVSWQSTATYLLNSLVWLAQIKIYRFVLLAFWEGNPPGTNDFPSQRGSSAERVSMTS